MSKEKVERYKREKANRKQIMKKERTVRTLKGMAAALVACALLAWAGFSVYTSYEAKQPRTVVEVDYDAVNSYLGTLNE